MSNRKKFPTLFRALPSESARNLARVAWIEHFGWEHIATMYEKTALNLVSSQDKVEVTTPVLITRIAVITVVSGFDAKTRLIGHFRVFIQSLFQSESKCEFFVIVISSDFNMKEN